MFYLQRIKDASWPESYRYFPHDLVPVREDKEALLSFFANRDAIIWACEWIQGLLGGMLHPLSSRDTKLATH